MIRSGRAAKFGAGAMKIIGLGSTSAGFHPTVSIIAWIPGLNQSPPGMTVSVGRRYNQNKQPLRIQLLRRRLFGGRDSLRGNPNPPYRKATERRLPVNVDMAANDLQDHSVPAGTTEADNIAAVPPLPSLIHRLETSTSPVVHASFDAAHSPPARDLDGDSRLAGGNDDGLDRVDTGADGPARARIDCSPDALRNPEFEPDRDHDLDCDLLVSPVAFSIPAAAADLRTIAVFAVKTSRIDLSGRNQFGKVDIFFRSAVLRAFRVLRGKMP